MLETATTRATRLAQEAERRRIARELHDNVVQSLTALVTDMEYLRLGKRAGDGPTEREMLTKLESWHELAQESLFAIRQALSGLRAQDDQPFDLAAAVEALLTNLQNAGYTVTFECSNWPASLPAASASHLFAIIREALINSAKHAHASTIHVCLFGYDDHLFVSVGDDGIGLEQASGTSEEEIARFRKEQARGYHQGLTSLRERVALLGGTHSFTHETPDGKGTRLEVEIPLPLPGATPPSSANSYPR